MRCSEAARTGIVSVVRMCARNALDSLLRLFCVADQPFASLRRKSEALCQSQKLKTISCTCSKQLQNAAIAAAEAANVRTLRVLSGSSLHARVFVQ